MIIGLIGVKGSGKDYFANELKNKYEEQGLKVKIIGFSDAVREATFKNLGIKPPQTEEGYVKFKADTYKHGTKIATGRYWLEYFAETSREINPIIWSQKWSRATIEAVKEYDTIIVNDVRFTNELQAVFSLSEAIFGKPAEVIFCDYRSDRYEDNRVEANKFALDLRAAGFKDRDSLNGLFSIGF